MYSKSNILIVFIRLFIIQHVLSCLHFFFVSCDENLNRYKSDIIVQQNSFISNIILLTTRIVTQHYIKSLLTIQLTKTNTFTSHFNSLYHCRLYCSVHFTIMNYKQIHVTIINHIYIVGYCLVLYFYIDKGVRYMSSAINLKPMLLCDQVKITIYLNRRAQT